MFNTYVQFGVYTEDRLIYFSGEAYVPTIKRKMFAGIHQFAQQ